MAQNEAACYAKATNERFSLLQEAARRRQRANSINIKAQEEQAAANLDLAKANVESAKLNLGIDGRPSPISGQISRYYLTLGNLVNQDVTQLTTLVSMNPMYVYFDMDEPTLMRIKQAIREGNPCRRREPSRCRWRWPARWGSLGFPGRPAAGRQPSLLPGRAQRRHESLDATPGDDNYKYEGRSISSITRSILAPAASSARPIQQPSLPAIPICSPPACSCVSGCRSGTAEPLLVITAR